MKLKIGLILTNIHTNSFKAIEEDLGNEVIFTYFIINNLDDVKKYYKDNLDQLDGFILSGPALYNNLIKEYKVLKKPCFTLSDDGFNFYRQLLTLIAKNPDIDSSRIYIDFANEYNNFLDMKEIFPEGKIPITLAWESQDYDEVSKNILANHIRLWEEKKVDLSFTRFGYILNELDKNKIDYLFLTPSKEYVKSTVSNLISEIKISKMQKYTIGVIYISLDKYSQSDFKNYDNYECDYYLSLLQRFIYQYSQQNNFDFVIQAYNNNIEIFTSLEEIYRLTDDMKNCSLQIEISNLINTTVSIGFGSGKTLSQAKINALDANSYARKSGGNSSYYIDEDFNTLGPIDRNQSYSFSHQPDLKILNLSDILGINNIYLQKLVHYTYKKKTNKVTIKEIADYLSIAHRSANRILNKIEERGIAKVSFEKRNPSRGRPIKYYELNFLKSDGSLIEDFQEVLK